MEATSVAGVSDYTQLTNKPSINSVELVGNKTLAQLGIQPAGNYLTALTKVMIESVLTGVITTHSHALPSHNHTVSQITDFPTTWAWSALSGVPTTFAPSAHTHSQYALAESLNDYLLKSGGEITNTIAIPLTIKRNNNNNIGIINRSK